MRSYKPIVFITLLLVVANTSVIPSQKNKPINHHKKIFSPAPISDFLSLSDQSYIISILTEIANLALSLEEIKNLSAIKEETAKNFGNLSITVLLDAIEEAGALLRHPPFTRSLDQENVERLANSLINCGTLISQRLNAQITTSPKKDIK